MKLKPRNRMIPIMASLKQGPHGKTTKAVRRKDKVDLNKTLRGVSGLAHMTLNHRGVSSNLTEGTTMHP
jgi:hypothetical protein